MATKKKTPSAPTTPSTFDVGSFRMAENAPVAPAAVARQNDEAKAKKLLESKGIGTALLFDPKYGKPNQKGGLWEVYQAYLAGNEGLAADLLNATDWMKLDTASQSKYLKSVTKTDAFKNDLDAYLLRIKKRFRDNSLTPPSDEVLKQYYIDGKDEDVIIEEAVSGFTVKGAGAAEGVVQNQPGAVLDKLRNVARLNGFNLERDFGGQIDGWVQRALKGEDVENFARLIRERAKLGLPDKVKSLIDEGFNLTDIYSPYIDTMSRVLEVNPSSIALNDPTLLQAYAGDKEMSLFDFKRALRKDARWQYTDNAREEVSNSALQVLRDFGFQG